MFVVRAVHPDHDHDRYLTVHNTWTPRINDAKRYASFFDAQRDAGAKRVRFSELGLERDVFVETA